MKNGLKSKSLKTPGPLSAPVPCLLEGTCFIGDVYNPGWYRDTYQPASSSKNL